MALPTQLTECSKSQWYTIKWWISWYVNYIFMVLETEKQAVAIHLPFFHTLSSTCDLSPAVTGFLRLPTLNAHTPLSEAVAQRGWRKAHLRTEGEFRFPSTVFRPLCIHFTLLSEEPASPVPTGQIASGWGKGVRMILWGHTGSVNRQGNFQPWLHCLAATSGNLFRLPCDCFFI